MSLRGEGAGAAGRCFPMTPEQEFLAWLEGYLDGQGLGPPVTYNGQPLVYVIPIRRRLAQVLRPPMVTVEEKGEMTNA